MGVSDSLLLRLELIYWNFKMEVLFELGLNFDL